MRAAIITIGDELLIGQTIDTDSFEPEEVDLRNKFYEITGTENNRKTYASSTTFHPAESASAYTGSLRSP